MYYFLAFICGFLAGAIVTFLVERKNAASLAEIEKRIKDTLGSPKEKAK